MWLEWIYGCCFCGKRSVKTQALLTVEDIVLAMERLPRDEFKMLLKYYIRSRSERDTAEREESIPQRPPRSPARAQSVSCIGRAG